MIGRRVAGLMLGLAGIAGGAAACGTSSAGAATTKMGLSPAVSADAALLRQFIGEKLVQSKTEASHETLATEGRRQLAALKAKATTDEDQNVVLLLANLMSKDNQRMGLVFMSRKMDIGPAEADIKTLYEARQICNDEILGWLERGKPVDRRTLERGPCLIEAQQAAAILKLR